MNSFANGALNLAGGFASDAAKKSLGNPIVTVGLMSQLREPRVQKMLGIGSLVSFVAGFGVMWVLTSRSSRPKKVTELKK